MATEEKYTSRAGASDVPSAKQAIEDFVEKMDLPRLEPFLHCCDEFGWECTGDHPDEEGLEDTVWTELHSAKELSSWLWHYYLYNYIIRKARALAWLSRGPAM